MGSAVSELGLQVPPYLQGLRINEYRGVIFNGVAFVPHFHPRGTLGNVWRDFWLFQWGGGRKGELLSSGVWWSGTGYNLHPLRVLGAPGTH